jgi:hypothetical protein
MMSEKRRTEEKFEKYLYFREMLNQLVAKNLGF